MKSPEKLIVHQLSTYNITRQSVDVQKYRQALISAERNHLPFRKALLDIYHELWLDAHLQAIIQKRIRQVTNTEIRYFEGQKDTETINAEYFSAPWFSKMIKYLMESLFWGHSLCEFELDASGQFIADVHLINRYHVSPERGLVMLNSPYDVDGLPFREKPYSDFSIEMGDGLGLMNVAAVNTILKRNGTIDFSNYVEMFGVPIRQYEYDAAFEGAKEEAETLARNSGNAAAMVHPAGQIDLKVHQGISSGSESAHVKFLEVLKQELTVLILGQTMTTENGSSRSQAEVHLSEQRQIEKEDKLMISHLLNWVAKEKFMALGLPISQQGHFEFVENEGLPVTEQAEIDLKIAQLYQVPGEYFTEKYGVPVDGPAQQASPQPPANIQNSAAPFPYLSPEGSHQPAGIWGRLKSALKLEKKSLSSDLMAAYEAGEFLATAFDRFLNEMLYAFRLDFPDDGSEIYSQMLQNIHEFAAMKAIRMLEGMEAAQPDGLAVQQVFNDHLNWLETEKQHCTASGQMARKWAEMKENEDRPWLQYVTAADERVRPNHRACDGITLPITHPFWQTHFPPLGYRCRCTARQLTPEQAAALPLAQRQPPADVEPDRAEFANNPGATGKVVPYSHPYFTRNWQAEITAAGLKIPSVKDLKE